MWAWPTSDADTFVEVRCSNFNSKVKTSRAWRKTPRHCTSVAELWRGRVQENPRSDPTSRNASAKPLCESDEILLSIWLHHRSNLGPVAPSFSKRVSKARTTALKYSSPI